MVKYKNPELPVEERVDDLMSRMTFAEKIDQITCLVTITNEIPDFRDYIPDGIGNVGAFTVADSAKSVAEYTRKLQQHLINNTRLGIPALVHCEAAAGAQFTEANVFPSAIAQASSFDPDNVRRMAEIIRSQLLAVGFRQALSPVLDIARDARWGRITETYGEDPTLTAAMGSAFVKGLQWENGKRTILATAKHFVGHGITEGGLNMGRSMITPHELEEVHCKPFQAAITESGLASVMNSYCQIDGEPVVGSKAILTDLLRGKLGFAGFVVSDYIAVDRLVDPFCVAQTYEEAGVRAINAGLDVEYPRPKGFTKALEKAVEAGSVSMETIDAAVRRVLSAKFEIGLFENPYPDDALLETSLHQPEADALNLKMAQEGIILLKNDNHALPLSDDGGKIVVLGPHADSVRSFFATFSYPAALDMSMSRDEDGQVFEEQGVIIYDIDQSYPGQIRESSPRVEKAIRAAFPNAVPLMQAIAEAAPKADVKFARGISYSGADIGGSAHALELAAAADIIILTLGGKNGWGNTSTVGEGVDATDIGLPGLQEEFAKQVYALGKKTIVVHFDGRPLSSAYVASHFDAIMEVWQPGEFGGQAIADVLFGRCNPAGRMPVTAARSVGQLPLYYSLSRGSGFVSAGHTGMIRNPLGYINDTAFPLYAFGHGLSYTAFAYDELRLSQASISPVNTLQVSIRVINIGEMDGDEVVQLYFSDKTSSVVRPQMELMGFARVHLKRGESTTVTFDVHASQTAFIAADGAWTVEKGEFDVLVGASSTDIRAKTVFSITSTDRIDA
ncbi:MAG: glycoside hydrolase family 3 N-terminal domain-containing protein, partial [Oscillospiraceae bacterium]|nr:glycoside hydrolase family 3 N-terminal domain-containing protein [Oscillospiraceae bacterium]